MLYAFFLYLSSSALSVFFQVSEGTKAVTKFNNA